MNVLISGSFPLNSDELFALESDGHKVNVHLDEHSQVAHPDQYDAVICNNLFLYNKIEHFTNLRLVQLTSVGFDRVPIDYIRTHNIQLYNAAGVYSIPMAEFVVCGILELYKQSRFFLENQMAHNWEKNRLISEVYNKRVCILGCGNVGIEIAKRLTAFGCYIIGVNRTVHKTNYFDEVFPLEELMSAVSGCNILICCMALTHETQGIVDKEIFDRIDSNGVFVNVARGGLVDETAMVKWLKSGGRAMLDVLNEEPLPSTNVLWDMNNVILTPHNSFVGEGNHRRLWDKIRENLK